jgi:hypothetical protein
MAVNGQEQGRAARLARERALYQYTSALDRGDFDAVAAVLQKAETDEVLERLILEVNQVYQAELIGAPAAARQGGRLGKVTRRRAGSFRRGGKMTDTQKSSTGRPQLRGRRLAPGLIAGAVVAAVVVTCIGAVVLASLLRGGGSYLAAEPSVDYGYPASAPGLPSWADDSGAGERQAVVEEAPLAPMEPGDTASNVDLGAGEAAGQAEERLIIRTGNISVRVEDTVAAQQEIEDLVARLAAEGAYVVSSEQSGGTDGQDPYITMSVRVPAARFDETMDAVAGMAVDVVSRIENSDDVTEEYVDLGARLEALEAARDRLLEIMSEANRTEDLLAAEAQLTQREAEIESIQGRMQYLSQSATLARIYIQLEPYVLSQPVGEGWRPAETVRNALEALLEGAQGLVDFAIFFGIAVLPWLLALALGVYLLYRIVRWAVRRRQAQSTATDTEVGG